MNELHDALADIAGRAHDPAPLAARIMAGSRTRRQRRGLLVAAAAAGTVAAGAVAVWPRRPENPAPPTLSVPSGPTSAPAPVPSPSGSPIVSHALMVYRPTWMPTGYVEVSRLASVPGTGPIDQTRSYERAGDADHPIHLFLAPRDPALTAGMTATTLGGRRAWLNRDPQNPAHVLMEVDNDLVLSIAVHREKDRAEIARHIAASIRPDAQSAISSALAFGWLPETSRGTVTMGLDGTALRFEQTLKSTGTTSVEASISWRKYPAGDAERLTLRGRPARLRPGKEVPCPATPPPDGTIACGTALPYALVDLGGGRTLHVSLPGKVTPSSRADLIRVVEEIRIGRDPNVSWLPR